MFFNTNTQTVLYEMSCCVQQRDIVYTDPEAQLCHWARHIKKRGRGKDTGTGVRTVPHIDLNLINAVHV